MSARAPGGPVGGAPGAENTDASREAAASLSGPGSIKVPTLSSHHGHDLGRWPLHDTLVLGAVESAVPSARAHLRQLLREWGRTELEEDASVVVSELVTNAVAASAELRPAAAPVLMWLGSDRHCVLAAVVDASPRPPMLLSLGPYAYGGRGLALVEALSTRWGWYPASIAGLVKAVWAEWCLPAEAGQQPATDQPNHRHAV
jgi:anti-sigma regulatory factor (Ser/Thr protein kinase)